MSATPAGAFPFLCGEAGLAALRRQFSTHGVAVLDVPALPIGDWMALRQEAIQMRDERVWRLYAEKRPGEIDQDNRRGYLGPAARSFLGSQAAHGLLYQVTGKRTEPGWSASCYTYYDEPGSYMGEHCDKRDACRVAMLVYLDAQWPADRDPSPGMKLHVYRGDSSRSDLVMRVTARSNRIVILNGAEQAHLRPPMAENESLIMLAGCFRAPEAG